MNPWSIRSQVEREFYLFIHRMRWVVEYQPTDADDNEYECSFHRTYFGALKARKRYRSDGATLYGYPVFNDTVRVIKLFRSDW